MKNILLFSLLLSPLLMLAQLQAITVSVTDTIEMALGETKGWVIVQDDLGGRGENLTIDDIKKIMRDLNVRPDIGSSSDEEIIARSGVTTIAAVFPDAKSLSQFSTMTAQAKNVNFRVLPTELSDTRKQEADIMLAQSCLDKAKLQAARLAGGLDSKLSGPYELIEKESIRFVDKYKEVNSQRRTNKNAIATAILGVKTLAFKFDVD